MALWISKTERLFKLLNLIALATLLACTGKSDQEYIQQAKHHQEEGDLNASIIDLKNALQQNPKNSEARLLLGNIYVDIREGAAAEKELRRAQELGIKHSSLSIALSKALLYQYKYQNVIEQLSRGDLIGLDEVWKETLLGEAHLGLSEIDQAQKAFTRALERQHDFIPALLGQAKLFLVQQDIEKANSCIQQILTIHPKEIDAWIIKGNLALLKTQYPLAKAAFEKALKLDLANPIPLQGFIIRARLAHTLITEGQSQNAIKHIDLLLKMAPEHPLPQYLQGLATYLQGDKAVAAEYFLNVLKKVPEHRPSIFLLGVINYTEGNLEQAEMYLSSFVAAVPSHVPARKLLVATALRLEQPAQAIATASPLLIENNADLELLSFLSTAALRESNPQESARYLEQAVLAHPENSLLKSKLAMVYLSANEAEKAIETLESSIKQENREFHTRRLLVLSHLQNKDRDKALSVASELAADYPDEPQSHSLLGLIYSINGEYRQARDLFETALKKNAYYIPAMLNLARLDYKQSNLREAKKRYEKIHLLVPKNIPVMMSLTQISLQLGERDQTEYWLTLAKDSDTNAFIPRLTLARFYLAHADLEKARFYVTEAMALQPENSSVLITQGFVDLAEKKFKQAQQTFQALIKKYPDNAEGHFYLAQTQLMLNKPVAARKGLIEALSLNPHYVQAAVLLAQIEIKAGAWESAQGTIAKLKANHPQAPLGLVLEGDLHMARKEYAKAATAYEKAVNRKQTSKLLLKQYQATVKSGNVTSANKLLEDWLAEHPKNAEIRIELAEAYRRLNRNQEAITHYEQVLRPDKNNPEILNNLAWLYNKQNDPRALRYAEQAYRAAPNNGLISDTLGWLYVQNGKAKQGLELLYQAFKQSPNSPDIHYHLASALTKTGQIKEAHKVLTELLATSKRFPDRQAAESLMKELQSRLNQK